MADTPTKVPLATTTLSSTTTSVSFTNISQNYTDLVIVAYVRGDVSNDFRARWGNSSYDSGTNYSNTGIYARSTTNDYGSERNTNFSYARLTSFTYGVPSATSTFGTIITHIMNYSNTTTYKTALSRAADVGADSYAGTEAEVILWRSTSAINQIQLYGGAGTVNFQSGSTFTLYGIL